MKNIIAFGDSTTDNHFKQKRIEYAKFYCPLKVYTSFIEDELIKLGKGDITVINSGISGDSSEDGRRRFEKDILSFQPSIVIIQFGCNDQNIRQDLGESNPRVTVPRYKENFCFFIKEIQRYGGKVILMTPGLLCWNEIFTEYYQSPPYDHSDPVADGNLKNYVNVLYELRDQFGLSFVDIYKMQLSYVNNNPFSNILPDGLHPNTEGHKMIAYEILPVLKSIIP